MTDFKGPETPGNLVLNFVLYFWVPPYIGFWNENVQHTPEQKKYALQCVSHICYEQIKLDCVTNMLQCCVHDDEASSMQVMQLLLKLAMQIGNF